MLVLVLLLLAAAPVALVFLLRDITPPEVEKPLPSIKDLDEDGRPDPAAVEYHRAAKAFQDGDVDAARAILARLATTDPEQAALANTLIGLYAYESGFTEVAIEALSEPGAVGGELEDWRLYALADAALHRERFELAAESLGRLIGEHPGSPLLGRAYVEAAELAWTRGDAERALSFLDEARRRELTRRVTGQADRLAWRIGRETGSLAVQREAAKRLLIYTPPLAGELDVADLFRDERGRIESWEGVLTLAEVRQRARSWIDLGDGGSAEATLDTVAPAHRGLEWRLLMAEALALQRQGRDALAVLERATPSNAAERAAVEWQKARATAELATARRGRANLSSAERRRMLRASQRHLENVVESGGDRELSIEALRQLYGYLAEEGLFDQAVAKLRLLRRLDPTDRTGAQNLWERGWVDYQRGNPTGAIGYWTELEELYPDDREARRGRYWKARAFEALDQRERAAGGYRRLLEESAAADFYYGRAAARLAGAPRPPQATGEAAAPPWAIDPLLQRSLRLVQLGLVGLARTELQLVGDDEAVDQRDLMALSGVLRVQEGQPREAVTLLRGAFPQLGGPYQSDVPGPVLAAYYPFLYREAIEENAKRTRLPPHLVAGIIRQESAFDPRAESWAGARGLMQLMPATAKEVAGKLGRPHNPSRLFDPDYSVLLGSTYFRETLDRFDGNVELALAGYNGGPNRIRRLWREAGPDPELDYFLESLKIQESQDYVKRILVLADSYRQLYWGDQAEVVASTTEVKL